MKIKLRGESKKTRVKLLSLFEDYDENLLLGDIIVFDLFSNVNNDSVKKLTNIDDIRHALLYPLSYVIIRSEGTAKLALFDRTHFDNPKMTNYNDLPMKPYVWFNAPKQMVKVTNFYESTPYRLIRIRAKEGCAALVVPREHKTMRGGIYSYYAAPPIIEKEKAEITVL